MTFYKATRPDGTDFYSGTVDYAAALESGVPVTAPVIGLANDHRFPGPKWLHMATVPTECVGMSWPCRLFEVEPDDDLGEDRPRHEHKVGATSVRVLREIDAHQALGPQGEHVAAPIERCRTLTGDELDNLVAAWAAARDAAWDAARDAAWGAAWDAARDAALGAARDAAWAAARDAAWAAAWAAARDAAVALVSRDRIGHHPGWDQGAYDRLTGPWRSVIGPIHPDDAPMAGSS